MPVTGWVITAAGIWKSELLWTGAIGKFPTEYAMIKGESKKYRERDKSQEPSPPRNTAATKDSASPFQTHGVCRQQKLQRGARCDHGSMCRPCAGAAPERDPRPLQRSARPCPRQHGSGTQLTPTGLVWQRGGAEQPLREGARFSWE